MKTILSIFGTRPEAIKMAPVIQEIASRPELKSVVCVTAQHRGMLDQVLKTFSISPDFDLDIMQPNQTLTHITAAVLHGIEEVIAQVKPDLVLVHGDTTTAMAAALAASYQQVPIGHVEAGLRTFDRGSPFPEENNRQIIDRLADFLFAPTATSAANLAVQLNHHQKVFITGNTAIDALKTTIHSDYHHSALDWVGNDRLILLTAHRRENLGNSMRDIFTAIKRLTQDFSDLKVVYPVHRNPRVREVAESVLGDSPKVKLIEPLDVIDFHNFMSRAYFIMSDSGGVQEEAPSLGKPVLVLRDTTERPEGVVAGTLKLVGTDTDNVYSAAQELLTSPKLYERMSTANNPYGDGTASRQIVDAILSNPLTSISSQPLVSSTRLSPKKSSSDKTPEPSIEPDSSTTNLQRQLDTLRRENVHLRRLTSSKRFQFAENVAGAYNQLFPVDTRRRAALSSLSQAAKRSRSKRQKRSFEKHSRTLRKLAAPFSRIIVLNAIPYNAKLKQRPQHLAKAFAKLGYFVIYLESQNPVHAFRTISPNLVTINDYRLLQSLQNNSSKFFLSPNNMPTPLADIQKILSWGYKFIYDYLDEFHEDISGDLVYQLEVWEHLADLHPVLCLATADRLKSHLASALSDYSCPILKAGNAVNVPHFDYTKQKASVPSDLAPILRKHRPIIGFYGALGPWIDYDLLNRLIKKHSEWEFVFLGVDYNGAASALQSAPNLHNLGSKPYSVLSTYSKNFDCAIIPFCTGDIAKATSPVKLYEYMAAGLPTVCTKDLDECRGYDYVYMAKNFADFEAKITKALAAKQDPEARTRLLEQAKLHTWSQCAKSISDALFTDRA